MLLAHLVPTGAQHVRIALPGGDDDQRQRVIVTLLTVLTQLKGFLNRFISNGYSESQRSNGDKGPCTNSDEGISRMLPPLPWPDPASQAVHHPHSPLRSHSQGMGYPNNHARTVGR